MKRLLTIILSAAMAAALMPMAAFADTSFKDISQGAWYKPAVDYVVSNGIMNGVGDNRFEPDANLTRGMIVQMLYNLESRPSGAADAEFSDVNSGAWYRDAVNWAAANDIVSGYGNSHFGPENSLTREQMAAVMQRYAQYKKYRASASESVYGFEDYAQISDWALNNVRWAIGEKLLSGVGEHRLDPSGTATRAQVAQVFKNFNDTVVKDNTGNDSGEWDAVNYTILRDDRSKPGLDYYYDYIQITDDDYPYAQKINSALEAEKNRFFSDSVSREYNVNNLYDPPATDVSDEYEIYQYWCASNFSVYSKNGYLSVASTIDIAMGGASHPEYVTHTYDLRTGKELTLPEILNLSRSETRALFIKILSSRYNYEVNEDMKELYGDPETADPDKLKFYIDSSGEIWIPLDAFEYVANGEEPFDTGYNVLTLPRPADLDNKPVNG